jgi:aspartate racemase
VKLLGVIGGLGPLAGAAFCQMIARQTLARTDQDHIHLLMDSDGTIPDRTSYLLGTGEDPRPGLIASAARLADAGAEVLVIPCNTANLFAGDVSRATSVTIAPWFQLAQDSVLAMSRGPVGLMATVGTLRSGHYQTMLRESGREVVVPNDTEVGLLMDAIYGPWGVKALSEVSESASQNVLAVAASMAKRGASAILLACTEVALVADRMPTLPDTPLVDPAVAVARWAITECGGKVRPPVRTRGLPVRSDTGPATVTRG